MTISTQVGTKQFLGEKYLEQDVDLTSQNRQKDQDNKTVMQFRDGQIR